MMGDRCVTMMGGRIIMRAAAAMWQSVHASSHAQAVALVHSRSGCSLRRATVLLDVAWSRDATSLPVMPVCVGCSHVHVLTNRVPPSC